MKLANEHYLSLNITQRFQHFSYGARCTPTLIKSQTAKEMKWLSNEAQLLGKITAGLCD